MPYVVANEVYVVEAISKYECVLWLRVMRRAYVLLEQCLGGRGVFLQCRGHSLGCTFPKLAMLPIVMSIW